MATNDIHTLDEITDLLKDADAMIADLSKEGTFLLVLSEQSIPHHNAVILNRALNTMGYRVFALRVNGPVKDAIAVLRLQLAEPKKDKDTVEEPVDAPLTPVA